MESRSGEKCLFFPPLVFFLVPRQKENKCRTFDQKPRAFYRSVVSSGPLVVVRPWKEATGSSSEERFFKHGGACPFFLGCQSISMSGSRLHLKHQRKIQVINPAGRLFFPKYQDDGHPCFCPLSRRSDLIFSYRSASERWARKTRRSGTVRVISFRSFRWDEPAKTNKYDVLLTDLVLKNGCTKIDQ